MFLRSVLLLLSLIHITVGPTPAPSPKPLGNGYNYLPEHVQAFLSTHETLTPWDFSFSYQPCHCKNASLQTCPFGSPGDSLLPSFEEPICDYYTRLGGGVASQIFSTNGLKATFTSSPGSGISDTLWRFPDVNYLAGSSLRYQDYTQKFSTYSSRSKPIPPEVYNDDYGVEVITNAPGIIRVVLAKPMIRWSLDWFPIVIPWKTTATVTILQNETTPHLEPEPLPIPSPSPSSSPSPAPSPSPSASPEPHEPVFPEFNYQPKNPKIPPLPAYHWELSSGPLANMPTAGADPPTYTHTYEICSSVFNQSCIGSVIKDVPLGNSKTAKLSCVGKNKERIIIQVTTTTAQCKLLRIKGDPILIQKMVVLGDFGEFLNDSSSVPFVREIVVPNIYTTTPIVYNPSISPPNSSTPSPLPFIFPVDEMNDPRIFTEFGKGGPDEMHLDWRVVLANSIPQPPGEILDMMFPSVDQGGIIVCETNESIKEACDVNSPFYNIPITADGYGFWFFVNPAIMNWFIGTHGGSEIAGTPNQLGMAPMSILSELEQRLDNPVEYTGGSDGSFGTLPDICNGDVQITLNNMTAEEGIALGHFDTSRPFLFLEDFTNWVVENNMPEIPGVCAIAEKLIQKRSGDGTFATGVDEYQSGISFLNDTDWLPPGYIPDISRSINPGMPGTISSYLNSYFSRQPLYETEKGNWFVDGPYLYKRLVDDDLFKAYQQAKEDQQSGFGQGWGEVHNMSAVIENIERNSIVNILVDISEELMYYVASTSTAYFTGQGQCTTIIDNHLRNKTVTGFITLTVCVPDLSPTGDPAGDNLNENGTIDYEIVFSCDPSVTLPNGTIQTLPPTAPGQCSTTQTDYLVNISETYSKQPSSSGITNNTVWSFSCISYLESAGNETSAIIYDTTLTKCQADPRSVCDNLGTCDSGNGGFLSKHKILWISFFVLIGLLLIICVFRVGEEINGRKDPLDAKSEEKDS